MFARDETFSGEGSHEIKTSVAKKFFILFDPPSFADHNARLPVLDIILVVISEKSRKRTWFFAAAATRVYTAKQCQKVF